MRQSDLGAYQCAQVVEDRNKPIVCFVGRFGNDDLFSF
jgi:hypothetical protein